MTKPNLTGGRGESPKLVVRVHQELYDALVKAAKKDRRTLSDFVRIVLEDRVKGGK